MVNFNHVVLALPFQWGCYQLMVWRGGDLSPVLPSLPRVVFDVVVSLILKEIVFYYLHRYGVKYSQAINRLAIVTSVYMLDIFIFHNTA